ncbi:leucyl/phenylalanyl-tRNA--protein transferase [Antarcticibacterium arcticum]|uniref:Leucyl/phenylalanyl-tRNA--protein transferase n=2 Tax=Antarcticibacterium arcticum TaxID=2585771 RepID=A0A5B8YJU0_9FLAO|nr:leucyl/phenylalanyl-tRNA--protein transferase [Antarcticibacterium arcticum]
MRKHKSYEEFPPVEMANEDGLLAIGGDLSVKRLLDAYCHGIFPWYEASQPVIWYSPDPRMVLFPHKLKVSKSMRKLIEKEAFRVTFDENFEAVINNCASISREGQKGTWITPDLKNAFLKLHGLGIAQSVEVWKGNRLVGGLYGIYLKEQKVFCGESMFAKISNASKYGFIVWVEKLRARGIKLIDCQVYTAHLESLGAEEIPRREFLKYLE